MEGNDMHKDRLNLVELGERVTRWILTENHGIDPNGAMIVHPDDWVLSD